MKFRIIPLLVSCFLLLTSMSECKSGDVPFIEFTRYSPICAELNGVMFTSGDYTYLTWGGSQFNLTKFENEFWFSFYRDIASEKDEVTIQISLHENAPFELNKKYRLDSLDNLKFGKISFTENGVAYNFISTEGYIVFTECLGGEDGIGSYNVSGYFEFTAVDSEKGLSITVTNGTFENIWT